jgi:hypothetical protein
VRRRALLAILAGLGCSGCGSKPLSSTQLVSRGTRVCSQAGRRTDFIATPASPAGTAAFLRRGIAVLTPELAALKALRPPTDVADVYSTAIKSFSSKLGEMRQTLRNLNRGEDPVVAIKALQQQLAPIESQENGAWQALQLSACLNR